MALAVRSNAAKGREAAVDRHDNASDEARRIARQPDRGAYQLIRIAKAPQRRMIDDQLAAWREGIVGVQQQRAVLIADEEARRDRIYAQPWAVLQRQLDRQPLGEIIDRGFGGGVADYAGQWLLGGHGRNVDD